jgi:hypothetical protein
MTDDNSDNVDIAEDLDAFEKEFFTKPSAKVEDEEVEVKAEDDKSEDEDETGEDDDTKAEGDADLGEDENDPPASEDDDEDEVEEETPPAKKKRHSAQERINELTAKAREAEREANALRQRLETLEASVQKKEPKSEETPLREMLSADAPNPDKLGEDGEPIYPLGEFDPVYIRDLTRFTIDQETKRAREEAKVEEQKERDAQIQKQIADTWIEKVDEAEKEIPDLREKMKDLTETFADLDPGYGQYLASTIMISELGPQIMNYLSENIGEAQKIVASGPAAATLAIGRLEAKLEKAPSSIEQAEPKRNKKVSEAPQPPESRTRGNGSKFTVSADTDDLDAFERVFFSK